MEQKIRELREQMEARLGAIDTKEKLGVFWQDFLGKKGTIAELMKGLGTVGFAVSHGAVLRYVEVHILERKGKYGAAYKQ